jgi:hypothetical protein
MKFNPFLLAAASIGASLFCSLLNAQQTATSGSSAVVPPLVNFSGKALDAQGKIVSGVAGMTFAIYQEESAGSPLWLETENVQADAKGNYTVQLGATKPDGLPLDLFTSGEARWLGVTVNGGQEQPRILLLSVPYALKAADAQTLGGLPASAFVLAAPVVPAQTSSTSPAPVANSSSAAPATSSDVTTSGGAVNSLPLFTTATNVQNSIVTQTGTTAVNVAGKLDLPATGAATATGGKNSQPETFTASAFNKTTSTPVTQTFQLQAEPAGNDTATPSGTLNLLYGSGTTAPAETGLKISPKGGITFAPGQTFPIANAGITDAMLAHPSLAVNAGVGLTGGGTVSLGGTTTLNLNKAEVPLLAAANIFTNNQAISAGISTWGLTVSQPSYQTILEQGPQSGIGTALEMLTTGTSGMAWQILNTGAGASQGPNKLNFRNDSAGLDVITLTASGQVGIGTNSPATSLDVFSNTAGNHAPMGRFGSSGTGDCNSITTYTGSGTTEMFQAQPGCFVPGAAAGDGGMRVNSGNKIILGDASTARLTLDSVGNAAQPTNAGGFVKAMAFVNGFQPPYTILRCFNSTLTGAAATTPPCGINFTEAANGVWDFAFNFEVDNRFYSTTLAAAVNLQPGVGSCIGADAISSDTLEVQTSDCNGNGKGDDFSLFIY